MCTSSFSFADIIIMTGLADKLIYRSSFIKPTEISGGSRMNKAKRRCIHASSCFNTRFENARS